MPVITKKEADAHDSILEAAAELSDLIAQSRIDINEFDLEELTIFLSQNAPKVKGILKPLKRSWP